MTGSFYISSFRGTLHADKIHVWFKIANITHALPVPVHRNQQTDLTSKRMIVSRSHHTVVAKFRTGVKFSPRYNNQGELTWSSLEIRIIRKIENLFDSFVNGMEPWGSVNLKIRIRRGQPTTVFYKRYVRKHCLEISIAWENLNMVVLFVFRISIVSTIFGYWAGFLFLKKKP